MHEDERVERFDTVRRLRRNWILPGVALAAAVAGACLLVRDDLAPFGAFLLWLGGWIAPITLLRNAFPLSSATRLEATSNELRVGDAPPFAVDRIKEARVVQRRNDTAELVVELTLGRFEKIALRLPASEADHLVKVLGVGAGQRRASFTLVLPFGKRFLFSFLLFGFPWILWMVVRGELTELLPLFVLIPIVIMPVCAAIAVVLGFLRGKVTVGADGFTTSWFGWEKHRRFAEVEGVERKPTGQGNVVVDTVVRFAPRRQLSLHVLDTPDTHRERGAESRALAETMEAAFERWQRAPAVAEIGAHLGRGARSAKDWLLGIDNLVRGAGNNYRIAAVTPEILSEVAKSTESAQDARIGAAVALLRMNDQAHRSTVRIAAEACAEPRTRVVLLELADAEGDEERITQALARVR